MRTQFAQTSSRRTAEAECPWSTKIVKVDGGYMVFESINDYQTWRSQQ
jgi:hypothetical protein